MTTHSSIIAWKSHRQRSLVSYSSFGLRVEHDQSVWAHTESLLVVRRELEERELEEERSLILERSNPYNWRRKWQPTPIFLPGQSHGQRSLAGYRPWVCKRVGHALAIKQEQTDHSIGRLVTCLALSEKTTLIFFGHLTHKKSHSEVGNLKIVCFCSMYCQ